MNKKVFFNVCLVLMLLLSIGFASAALSDGLVSYYSLDSGTSDSQGLYNGTLNNDAFINTSFGKLGGGSLETDGNLDSMSIGASSSMLPNTSFAVNGWARARSFPDSQSMRSWTFHRGTPSSGVFTQFYDDGGSERGIGGAFRNATVTDVFIERSSDSLNNVDTWYMVTQTFNGSHSCFYIDGSLYSSCSTGVSSFSFSSFDAALGGYGDDSFNGALDGYVDEVGVWNRSLTSLEVTELYNSGTGIGYSDIVVTTDFNFTDSLISAYSFDIDSRDDYTGFYNASTSGSVVFSDNSLTSGSVYFDGSTASLSIPDYDIFSPTDNPLSISLWAQINGTPDSDDVIIAKGAAWEWAIRISDGVVGFTAWQAGGSDHLYCQYAEGVSSTGWTHIGLYINASDKLIGYMNGSQVCNDTTPTGIMTNDNSLTYVGRRSTGNNYKGYVDELFMWSREVTASEFSDLYNAGVPRTASYVIAGGEEEASTSSLNDSLLSCYDFDTDGVDYKNINNISLDNNSVSTTKKIGSGSLFCGGSASDDFANANTFWNSNSSFSIEGFVKPMTSTAGNKRILAFPSAQGSTNTGISLYTSDDDMKLMFRKSDTSLTYPEFTLSFSTDTWYHVVTTYNGSVIKTYLDGTEIDSETQSFYGFGDYPSYVCGFGDSDYFNGYVDELKMFDTALNTTQISELYNGGNGRSCSYVVTGEETFNFTDSLISYYSFDVNASDDYDDNHGNIIGNASLSTSDYVAGSGSFQFDGDDFIQIDSDASTNFISEFDENGNWTICAWYKTTQTDRRSLFTMAYTGSSDPYLIMDSPSTNTFRSTFRDSGLDYSEVSSTVDYTNGSWHFFCGQREGNTSFLYADGSLIGNNTNNNVAAELSLNQANIGVLERNTADRSGYLIGKIDELAIWQKKLSVIAMDDLYNSGSGRNQTYVLGLSEESPSNAAPVSSIEYPSDSSSFPSQSWMNFSLLGTDAENTSLIGTLFIDGVLNQTNSSLVNNSAWNINVSGLSLSSHTAIFEVDDGTNKTNSSQVTFDLSAVSIDTPVINITMNNFSDYGKDYGLDHSVSLLGSASYTNSSICKLYGCVNLTTNGGDALEISVAKFDLSNGLAWSWWDYRTTNTNPQALFSYDRDQDGRRILTGYATYCYDHNVETINSSDAGDTTRVGFSTYSSGCPATDTWTHNFVQYDPETRTIQHYMNGQLFKQEIEGEDTVHFYPNQTVTFGMGLYGIDFEGYMDELLVYNQGNFSADYVSDLFSSQRLGTPPTRDLYVSSVNYSLPINWSDANNNLRSDISELEINFTIKNEGSSSVGSFDYRLLLDDVDVLNGSTTLSSESSLDLSYNWTVVLGTAPKFEVQLDYNSAIVEDEEDNNNYLFYIVYDNRPFHSTWNSTIKDYCDNSSNELANDACGWVYNFVSEDFNEGWSATDVDPRGKKGYENALGCFINDYAAGTQCTRARNHLFGWANRTQWDDAPSVQAVHELIWVGWTFDLMFGNLSESDNTLLAGQYMNICNEMVNHPDGLLYNDDFPRPPTGGNGQGFGSGIFAMCDYITGLSSNPTNMNDQDQSYWGKSNNVLAYNRVEGYLKAFRNDTNATYQEGNLYKWYSQTKIVPVSYMLNKYDIYGFGTTYNNAFCSMGREAIIMFLDDRYDGSTVFNDESRNFRQISRGDTNSYEDLGSGTVIEGSILTYYGLMCDDQEIKNALYQLRLRVRDNGDDSWAYPEVSAWYELEQQVDTNYDINDFEKATWDAGNEVFLVRDGYSYKHDTIFMVDGGDHKMSGHPNAQGWYYYFNGYNFFKYAEVPYNDNVRAEMWANAISFLNSTDSYDYPYTGECGGAPANQYYGDGGCSPIGTYPDFEWNTDNETGNVSGVFGSSDGLFATAKNIVPMSGSNAPIEEYFVKVNNTLVRFVKVFDSETSKIYDNHLNDDTEINVSSSDSQNFTFQAFDNQTFVESELIYSNTTGELFVTDSGVQYGFTKTESPTGAGNYRRTYYLFNDSNAEWIRTYSGYSASESKAVVSSTVAGSDQGVMVGDAKVLFDSNNDGVIESDLFVTDADILVIDANGSETYMVSGATYVTHNYNSIFSGAESSFLTSYDAAIPLVTITLSDNYFLNSTGSRIDSFNDSVMNDIEKMVLNYTIDAGNKTIDDWYFNFTADGLDACARGNKFNGVCFNYDDVNSTEKWVQFLPDADSFAFDGRDDFNTQGDGVTYDVVVINSSYWTIGLTLDEHYNPNVIKPYGARYNFSDVKWQDGVSQRITDDNYIWISAQPENIPFTVLPDRFKLDIRVNYTTGSQLPDHSLDIYTCFNYSTGDPAVISNCALLCSQFPSDFQDDGTKVRCEGDAGYLASIGGIPNNILLKTDEHNNNKYYYIKTFKATAVNYTPVWSFSNDAGDSWANTTDGYESEMNVNYFNDGVDPTRFVGSLFVNTTDDGTASSLDFITMTVDPTKNYAPICGFANISSGSSYNLPKSFVYNIVDSNDDLLNVTVGLYNDDDSLNTTLYNETFINGSALLININDSVNLGNFILKGVVVESNTSDGFSDICSMNVSLVDVVAIDVVSVIPSSPTVDDSIAGYATISNNASSLVNYSYSWFVDGVAVKNGSSNNVVVPFGSYLLDTLASSFTSVGDVVIFSVNVTDGVSSSGFSNSSSVVVTVVPEEEEPSTGSGSSRPVVDDEDDEPTVITLSSTTCNISIEPSSISFDESMTVAELKITNFMDLDFDPEFSLLIDQGDDISDKIYLESGSVSANNDRYFTVRYMYASLGLPALNSSGNILISSDVCEDVLVGFDMVVEEKVTPAPAEIIEDVVDLAKDTLTPETPIKMIYVWGFFTALVGVASLGLAIKGFREGDVLRIIGYFALVVIVPLILSFLAYIIFNALT